MHKTIVFILHVEDKGELIGLSVIPNEFIAFTMSVNAVGPQITSVVVTIAAPQLYAF